MDSAPPTVAQPASRRKQPPFWPSQALGSQRHSLASAAAAAVAETSAAATTAATTAAAPEKTKTKA